MTIAKGSNPRSPRRTTAIWGSLDENDRVHCVPILDRPEGRPQYHRDRRRSTYLVPILDRPEGRPQSSGLLTKIVEDPVPILDRPEGRPQSAFKRSLAAARYFGFQSSIAPKDDRNDDSGGTFNSYSFVPILDRPEGRPQLSVQGNPPQITSFQSSIAPKDDRNLLVCPRSLGLFWVPILDRPEGRPQFDMPSN